LVDKVQRFVVAATWLVATNVFVPPLTVSRKGETTLVASLVNEKLLVVKVATTTGSSELVLTETVFVATYTPLLRGALLVKIVVPATLVKAAVLVIAAYALVVVTTVFVDTTVLVTGAQSVKV
jgi:hypothetical protein